MLDMTHVISPETPLWTGPGYEPFQTKTINTLESDGVYARCFTMTEHMGTHVDAPSHFVADGASIDGIALREFICELAVVDVRLSADRNADYDLQVSDLEAWEKRHGRIPQGAAVLSTAAGTAAGRHGKSSSTRALMRDCTSPAFRQQRPRCSCMTESIGEW